MKKTLVVLLLVLMTTGCAEYRANIQSAAEANANVYALKFNWKVQGVSCSDNDSDNDYYVSCDVQTLDKAGNEKMNNLECGYGAGSVTGCKTRFPKIIQKSES